MLHNHYKEKINLNVIYLICLLLLTFYGFYKNGLNYYFDNQITFLEALKPLEISLSGLFVGLIVDMLIYHKLANNYLLGFLISVSLPYQISVIISTIIIGIILFIFSKFKITFSPIYLIIIILIFIVNNNYANIIENNNQIFYKTIDIFLGKNIGGVAITNILLLIISLIFLCTSFYYKKEIALITLVTYLGLTFFGSIINDDANLFINLLNSSVFYNSIFLIPFNNYSPINKKNQIFYALFSGICIFIGKNSISGVFLAAFISNTIFYLIDILSKKRTFIA